MKRRKGLLVAAALGLAPLVSGGAQAAAPPANGGTITIEPRTADGEYDPSLHIFVEAATQALTSKGFTVLEDPMHTAYVAELTLSRAGVGMGLGNPGGASVGLAGTGVVVPFPTGQSNVVTLRRTRLELRILQRDSRDTVWDGTAVTVRAAGTKKGTDETVASDLSNALLQRYPAPPEDVIGIP